MAIKRAQMCPWRTPCFYDRRGLRSSFLVPKATTARTSVPKGSGVCSSIIAGRRPEPFGAEAIVRRYPRLNSYPMARASRAATGSGRLVNTWEYQ